MSTEDGIELLLGRQLDEDGVAFDLDRECKDLEISIDLSTVLEGELLLVKRAGDLLDAVGVAENALRQHKGLLVGAHVLRAVPFSSLGVVKDGELSVTDKDWRSDVGRKVFHGSNLGP